MNRSLVREACRRLGAAAVAMAVATGLSITLAPAASAESIPGTPVPTVTADALPTVQISGGNAVVWSQVIVGDTVYATGDFTSARPSGVPAGTSETPRSNLLAYQLSTGNLITSWAPTINGTGLVIRASADGSTIYVGGSFTQVSGTIRSRIAAIDAISGALKPFNPDAGTSVRAIAAIGNTVYLGGDFSSMGGQARTYIAATDATSGALQAWAPNLSSSVYALVAPAGSGRVFAGGRFQYANGVETDGIGAFAATDASLVPWNAYRYFPEYGTNAAINSLSTDGTQIFGTAYDFRGPAPAPGSPAKGRFEGTFGADIQTGTVNWINGCYGDTYDSAPANGVLYNVSHAHDCGMVQGNPQTSPNTYQRAQAETTTPAADGRVNTYGSYPGYRAPELLHWLPTMLPGPNTGQAGWSVAANSQYVAIGGEFPTVNGVAQQGLTRFSVSGPNKEGPQTDISLTPVPTSVGPGATRLTWTAAWDRDNANLSYDVLRGTTVANSTVLATITAPSKWWSRPTSAYVDATAAPGSTPTYRIRVHDYYNNTVVSPLKTFTVEGGTAQTTRYADAVRADNPSDFWRFGESSGTTAYDWVRSNDLKLDSSDQRATAGATTDGNYATTLTGIATVPATTQGTAVAAPATFSVEAWIRTTSALGGKIIGYGNSSTGASGTIDRNLYMTNAGKVVFGVNPGTISTISGATSYNDGRWHHLVGTLGSGGTALYVDGTRVAAQSGVTTARSMTGFWRIGGDSLSGWPNAPTSRSIAGVVDDVAVFPAALTAAQVATHWARSGAGPNQPPVAAFTSTTNGLTASFDGSGSSDPDGAVASYAWTYGDTTTGTGATSQHTYPAAGTYQVTLTVTDNQGATNAVTKPVAVSGPAVYAADTFTRTSTSGFGTAETGGAWTVTGAATSYTVDGSTGRIQDVAGSTRTAYLNSVSQTNTELALTVALDKVQTGGGSYATIVGRRVDASDEYRVRIRYYANNTVTAQLTRLAAGTETTIGTAVTVPGATAAAGEALNVRFQVIGTDTTSLNAKVWKAGTTEPASWTATATDTTAGLQAPGGVGLQLYLSGTATNGPLTATIDNLTATPPTGP